MQKNPYTRTQNHEKDVMKGEIVKSCINNIQR